MCGLSHTQIHTHKYTGSLQSGEHFDNVKALRPKSSLKDQPLPALSQHLTICGSACECACAPLRPMIKAACGDMTGFTMTPNSPQGTVDRLLLIQERKEERWDECGGKGKEKENS